MDTEELKKENERLQNELLAMKEEVGHLRRQVMMAVNLRFHLMPNVFPVFPDLPEVDVYADQISLAHVGGDFFDIFRIDADHIGLLVADIFDGGDAAALFMVTFKLYLSGELAMGFSPDELMRVTNNRLARANEDDVCLSAWYGEYEVSTGKLRAVNAGHEAPLLLHDHRAFDYYDPALSWVAYDMDCCPRAVLLTTFHARGVAIDLLFGFSKTKPQFILSVCQGFAKELMGRMRGIAPEKIFIYSCTDFIMPLLRRLLDSKYEMATEYSVMKAKKEIFGKGQLLDRDICNDRNVWKWQKEVKEIFGQRNINEKAMWRNANG